MIREKKITTNEDNMKKRNSNIADLRLTERR